MNATFNIFDFEYRLMPRCPVERLYISRAHNSKQFNTLPSSRVHSFHPRTPREVIEILQPSLLLVETSHQSVLQGTGDER